MSLYHDGVSNYGNWRVHLHREIIKSTLWRPGQNWRFKFCITYFKRAFLHSVLFELGTFTPHLWQISYSWALVSTRN